MPKRPKGPMGGRDRAVTTRCRNLILTWWWGGVYKPARLVRCYVARGGVEVLAREEEGVPFMPRVPTGAAASGQPVNRTKTRLLGEKLPELASWLSDATYPDGKPVGMVQLSMRPKGAVYVVQLRIEDHGGLIVTVEDASLDDALVLLEATLTSDPIPWVRDPYPLGSVTKKKK